MKSTWLLLALMFVVGCGGGARQVSAPVQPVGKAEEVASLRKRVLKHPTDVAARLALGEELLQQKQFEEAVAQFDSVLLQHPASLPAKFGRATALYHQGRQAVALSGFLDVLNAPESAPYVPQIAAIVGMPYSTRQLTFGPGDNIKGRYSLAGNEIVFQSNRDGNWEIYRMPATGGNAVRLTYDPGDDLSPDFSPDGRLIVFASTRGAGDKKNAGEKQRGIYQMHAADGSRVKRLVANQHDNWNPVHSPKGGWLVFVSDRDDQRDLEYGGRQSDLFIYDFADSSIKRFTHGFGDKSAPFVNHTGEVIYYINNVNGDFEIYEQGVRETNGHRLLFEGGPKGSPQCSEDGKWLVYFEKNQNNFDLYLHHLDSRQTERLTSHPARDTFPALQRYGSKILFTSNRTGSHQLFEIDLKKPITREELSAGLSHLLSANKTAAD
ncbi:MAG: hypothetical protein ONB48_14730 [candidate division KSB1 bacterium]|nr:hypothetical protein [candidate division KSB1 bacterium]MDZ7273508.1 hypothetical protein [candidate division KSB1 bacterium]MDZ7286901.1 hypothetical protein [candidate division KSB1 bacterium]MDZ7299746.1 hypothetical protein [candidate division KSB1 bacterium]MDZ7305685.1 hypothetical protein [candidate division KSB1 bacterium]